MIEKQNLIDVSSMSKQDIISNFACTDKDTGSPEVQVALITKRIKNLTEYFKSHKQDKHSHYGMMKIINLRWRLLKYLRSIAEDRYKNLIVRLGLRK